jgi:hypothetical protein
MRALQNLAGCLAAALLLAPLAAAGQSKTNPQHGVTKLRVEVTAGDKDQPVESASVYVRYTVERALLKNKKVEMNLKTNQEGIAMVRDVPRVKVLVQVIADGWKTFGQYYTLDQDEQTIHIKLEKVHRWY